MIDLKELAEANRHCRNDNCDGCPFQNEKECENHETMNAEMFEEFLDMFGIGN